MNNEQFQMLMNLAENTSDGAFWLIVVFFAVKVIGWLIAATVAVITFHYIRSIFSENSSEHEVWVKEIYCEVTGNTVSQGIYALSDHRVLLRRIVAERNKTL